ncbi:ribosomal protein S18-alanine N-acetyltransferase [Edwardsiella piscicida]|uniref:[Ribosomal protein bS18]-alanine N-acetyltransferase n=3 Tax=Edwardsiella TaxID=635 RepID=A0A0H3DN12_EDWTF|nr:ribosomal protein S18-alanine N-acetyltransferase [Edwardsiella piscicida]ACY83324.1 acetylation of N-terminal alanine [Edwardsiella tarda EIB202]ADM40554.1 Ribosomal-protein-S18p-alanine acetyltransferase [Edwardsiella tarda FL6-60]AGH72597.1 ribosomal-protein-alanine N-acetyltransferase [Edwardsiella piscicida C07-087]AOP41987.1 ribosomal protein S18-alanine N-acetyltransferase [Edwardsiella piscicida]ARD17867.1 ribosomal-protein-alanine N-acetyltransferase RimI [Edwardsiella piscicida]
MSNIISSLTPADTDAAYAVECASHAFPWTHSTFLSNQGERYYNLKLESQGQLAAFAITQVVLDEATLFNVAVAPAYQRQGLGRTLLLRLIDDLTERGVVTLWLEVRDSNRAAIALYHALGFNEVSLRRNYYPTADGREDARIMALPLG